MDVPSPVPNLVDANHSIGNLDVLHGELLIANVHTIVTTVDLQIRHVPSGSVLNEDTFMLRIWILGHADLDVLKTGSLRGRPMNTADLSVSRNCSKIDLEISNLSRENIR